MGTLQPHVRRPWFADLAEASGTPHGGRICRRLGLGCGEGGDPPSPWAILTAACECVSISSLTTG